jgi:hypothetical protein
MFVTISACLFASAQRVDALGGNVGFWADDDNSYTKFPHAINSSNLAQVAGINGAQSASVRWGDGTKWGFSWTESVATNNNLIELQYGNGDYGATFGLDMWASDDGIDEEDGGDNAGAKSSMGLSGSYGRVMDFGELGVGFWNNSSDDGDTGDDDYDNASMKFAVNLRRAQSLWIFDNMLVNFTYGTNNNVTADGSPGFAAGEAKEFAQTSMELSIDYYSHLDIGGNTTALVAMGFGYTSLSDKGNVEKATETTISLPNWTIGIESAWTDWATMRVGLNSSYNLSSTSNSGATDAKDVTKRGAGTTSFAYGVAFNYGNFSLDMTVSEDLFVNPVQYVAGYEDLQKDVATSMATLTYTW